MEGCPQKGPPVVTQPAAQHVDQPLPHYHALLVDDTDQPLPIRARHREFLDRAPVAAPKPGAANDPTVISQRAVGPQQLLEKPFSQLKLGVRLVQLLPYQRLTLVSLDRFERLRVERQRGREGDQEHAQPQHRRLNQPVVPAAKDDFIECHAVIAISQQHLPHLVVLIRREIPAGAGGDRNARIIPLAFKPVQPGNNPAQRLAIHQHLTVFSHAVHIRQFLQFLPRISRPR